MVLKTTKLSKKEDDSYAIMLYGEPGTGKTVGAASLSTLGQVLYVDVEGGMKLGALSNHKVNLDNIEIVQASSLQEYLKLPMAIRSHLSKHPEIMGVVWDSISEIQSMIVDDVTNGEVPEGKDWQKVSVAMRRLIRQARDLPVNTVFTALSRRDVDDATGRVKYGPFIAPSVSSEARGYCDVVVHTTVENDKFIGHTTPTGVHLGKDRLAVLPTKLANPNILRILSYIKGDLTEATDPDQQTVEVVKPKKPTRPVKKVTK